MDLARTARAHDSRMARGDVAHVRNEPVVREQRVHPPHQAVACDLGDDGRRGDRGAAFVAVDDGCVYGRGGAEPEAVDETRLGRRGQLPEDRPEPGEVAAVEPGAVDLVMRDDAECNTLGAADDRAEKLLPLLGSNLLRVVEERQRADTVVAEPVVVEQDTGDDQRPCEGSPTGLVGAGDEPGAEPAVEAKKPLSRSLLLLLAQRPLRLRPQLRRQVQRTLIRVRARRRRRQTRRPARQAPPRVHRVSR